MLKKIIAGTVLSAITLFAVPNSELKEMSSNAVHPITSQYKHQLMIYGWLAIPSGEATFQVPNPEPGEPEEVESSIADNIDMVFMGTYRLEKDKYSVILDGVYLGMSGKKELIGRDNDAEVTLDGWLAALYGGYNIVNNQYIRFDVVGGLRYAYVKTGLETSIVKDRSLSKTVDLVDGVVGVDGTAYITKNWFIPYHFDIGAGMSDFTLRTSTGIGYGFGWGDVLLTYRYLYYDVSDSLLLENIDFAGPLVGVNFRF